MTSQLGTAGAGISGPSARWASAAMVAVVVAAGLSGCGGGSAPPEAGGSLAGTDAGCTIADGASSCTATVAWSAVGTHSVALAIAGSTVSTDASGRLTQAFAPGSVSIALTGDGQALDSRSLKAACQATSFWNGQQCQAASAWALGSFSVADGATGVDVHQALSGDATQPPGQGTATLACHDRDNDSLVLPATATVSVSGLRYSLAPAFAGAAVLPYHAACTLTASITSVGLQAATLGPIHFSTIDAPALDQLLVTGGSGALPHFLDLNSGQASTPAALQGKVGNCVGAYERYTGLVRLLCGNASGGASSVWDVDAGTGVASPVTALDSLFNVGSITEPQLLISSRRTQYMTRGALQSDGSSNSAIVVVTASGHSLISWDWAGRRDWIARLLLDEAAGRLFAVSHLGLIKVISTATLSVTGSFDLANTVNDAVLVDGRVAVAIRAAADGTNLQVFDPVTQALVSPVAALPGGKAAGGLSLWGADLYAAGQDGAAGVTTGKICRLDRSSFTLLGSSPCTPTTGTSASNVLLATPTGVYGDVGNVLTRWNLDLSGPGDVLTLDGPILAVKHLVN